MNEVTNFRGDVLLDQTDAGSGESTEVFLGRVGDRVRKARERKGIARRVLSELSGVSQRYLAQLEAGEGNISIALLHRIAHALDHRVEWLVGEEDPWSSETARVAELFRTAATEQRRKVVGILDPENPAQLRRQRVCLIGLRGAGKSTLGRMLGAEVDIPFAELNREIEEQSGMPVDEVMALYGQEGYRRLERQAVERVVATTDSVILAVAGGIVSEPSTYSYLLRSFHTIWLKATPEEHMSRVRRQGDERPMAGNPKAMEELKSILTSRETLYARAEIMINTSNRMPEEVLGELRKAIRDLGIT
ncbi:MAG: helix-turn-helix transcriptional regulator [Rhizobiaceae bacterium]